MRQNAPQLLDLPSLLLHIVAQHVGGVGISGIEAALAAAMAPSNETSKPKLIPRRTVQRQLQALVLAHKLALQGGSRSALYYAKPSAIVPLPEPLPAPLLALTSPAAPIDLAHPGSSKLYANAINRQTPTLAVRENVESYVPISPDALQLRDALRQPQHLRKPVGYQRAFLDAYRPNVDCYLSQSQRDKLREQGCTIGDHRPAGTYARHVLDRLLIDLSWASSRLEGNTYTRLDTQRLIEQGLVAQGKAAQETQMILNHKAAIEMLVENADDIGFNAFTVLNLHAILSDNLMADPQASGRLRRREVQISGTVFMPLAMPQQIAETFERLLSVAARIDDPFEQAFFGMVHLPYLQPFEDVNKRVSRLAANIGLIRHNLCPLSFVDVPERAYIEGTLAVYEQNRVELLRDVFLWAYERSCQRYLAIRQTIGEPDAFRMKYRDAISQSVQNVVLANLAGSAGELAKLAAQFVQPSDAAADSEAFIDAVNRDLNYLYEGNIARYRLRLAQFHAWAYKR